MLKIKTKDIVTLLLYSVPNTLLSISILYVINNVIANTAVLANRPAWLFFFCVIFFSYLLNISFQKHVIRYSNQLIYENELRIFKAIQQTDFSRFETFGADKFYSIVEDLRVFVFLPGIVTNTINALLMTLICFVYLLTISIIATIVIVLLIACIVGAYFLISRKLSKRIGELRQLNDWYYKLVGDVLKGFRELKVSKVRSANLFNRFLQPNREQVKEMEMSISTRFLAVNMINQYGLYAILGIILFALPVTGFLKAEDIVPFAVVVLFISGPVNTLVSMQAFYTRAFVSNKRIVEFLRDFKSDDVPRTENVHKTDFVELELRDITYRHVNPLSETSFSLGPVNLSVIRGETIFIIGGNGSGKSTFINVLTGLYRPASGKIYLNGQAIENDDQQYKDQFSPIFTDNHLFAGNYEDYALENNRQYEALLERMDLQRAVPDSREASARRKFSKGQSKRMSMIFALLEDHPVLVLDEWAADQDPHFRKYFYEKLLPRFKSEGRTVIAATHDDAYFQYADRIVKFEYGMIVKDVRVKDQVFDSEAIWSEKS